MIFGFQLDYTTPVDNVSHMNRIATHIHTNIIRQKSKASIFMITVPMILHVIFWLDNFEADIFLQKGKDLCR